MGFEPATSELWKADASDSAYGTALYTTQNKLSNTFSFVSELVNKKCKYNQTSHTLRQAS